MSVYFFFNLRKTLQTLAGQGIQPILARESYCYMYQDKKKARKTALQRGFSPLKKLEGENAKMNPAIDVLKREINTLKDQLKFKKNTPDEEEKIMLQLQKLHHALFDLMKKEKDSQ